MITYTTKKIKSDKYFTKAEEVIKYINEFGTTKFNGKRLSIVMKSDNMTEIMKLDKVTDDITVLTTDSIISKIQMISNAKVNPSKLDLIKSYIDTYNVTVQGKKTMSYLLKIIDDTDIDGSMDALCKKCNNIITEDIILSNFVVDSYIHPINVLKAVLKGYNYKQLLFNCRMLYTDKGIITGFKKHLSNIIEDRYISAISGTKQKWYSLINIDKIIKLYYIINTCSNLDYALVLYKGGI